MPTKKTTATTTTAPDFSVFNVEVSPSLISQAIYIYQANSHRGVAKVKTRGEVTASTRKIYKQKGTGNARHGAKSAPIFVGGGVVFGPTRLSLLDSKELKDKSTKKAIKLLPEGYDKQKTSLVHFGDTPELLKSLSNVKGLTLLAANRLNAYKVAQSGKVILTATALDYLGKKVSLVKKATTK
ncbi:MAG: 50S ribosomal protein L4 [Candidatus Collierbacteria bacterium GW2011_GWF1_44_12]|uniref:Large ribosomal subunit protein uL4 n=1 Tax=Candidatus Collierbacteria bacterium GW2011_GWF1_44_12 TaxID=1618402 RepID=A0A0G1GXT0_9BACT|nr:MAG: 50S ribosomal protein L4 [Candidatus Collierbacteria bacterium GW2011_GWF1_44_12]